MFATSTLTMPTEQQTTGKSVTIRFSHNVLVVLRIDTNIEVSRITDIQKDVYTETKLRQYKDPTWKDCYYNAPVTLKYLVNPKQELVYIWVICGGYRGLCFKYIIYDCQLTKITMEEYIQGVDKCHLENLNNKYRSELARISSQAPKATHTVSKIRTQVSD